MADTWLGDFMEYSTGGESPRRYMFWVGVATIAGALRRKVWIDQINFQWTPNFYVLLVGPPGGPRKTTSINIGMNLLKRVPDIDFGPQIVTWQQLVTHMAEAKVTYKVGSEDFVASCVTISISEFGTFFDPLNRELVDNLTDMWDGKLGTIRKETRTMGSDEIVNPWLNIVAGTTPGWISDNFSAKLIRSGFASRPIFIYEETPEKDVAYINRQASRRERYAMAESLIERLTGFAELAGEFNMSEEAYVWGEQWYSNYRKHQRSMGTQTEAGFYERQQTHLHKLAMVICVSRGGFPNISVDDMKMADCHLNELEPDVREIFGHVGRTRMSNASCEIVEVLQKEKELRQADLFKRYFFRTMSGEEFEIALKSVKLAGVITITGPLDNPLISLKVEEEPK